MDLKCQKCGSRFELTKHHYKDKHLPSGHPKKSNKVKILCVTCHEEVDFMKTLNCYHKAMMREYIKQTNKLYESFNNQEVKNVTKTQ